MEDRHGIVGILVLLGTFVWTSASFESVDVHSYQILEGDNLLVTCNDTDFDDSSVFWTRNDSKSTFYHQGKRLEILKINRSFSGEYICTGRNTSFPHPQINETDGNVTILVINVDVQYPAEVNLFHLSKQTVLENDTYAISCNVDGNPSPLWTLVNKDSGKILMVGANALNFTLSDIKAFCEDSGFWECTGFNVFNNGVNATRGANLTVHCPPRPQFDKNTYLIQTVLGDTASFVMNLLGNPPPNNSWSKDDGTIISNFTTQEDTFNQTTLTFHNITVQAFGKYTLKMQNEFGVFNAQYTLEADGPPETPTNLMFSDVTSHTVKLYWTSGFDMGSRQHFYIMKQINGSEYIQWSDEIDDLTPNHGVNQNWTHTVTGLVSNTYYNLSIVSVNDRGYNSKLATPAIGFYTKRFSDNLKKGSDHVTLIVGIVIGTIATMGIILFAVYIYKYKTLKRTKYMRY